MQSPLSACLYLLNQTLLPPTHTCWLFLPPIPPWFLLNWPHSLPCSFALFPSLPYFCSRILNLRLNSSKFWKCYSSFSPSLSSQDLAPLACEEGEGKPWACPDRELHSSVSVTENSPHDTTESVWGVHSWTCIFVRTNLSFWPWEWWRLWCHLCCCLTSLLFEGWDLVLHLGLISSVLLGP